MKSADELFSEIFDGSVDGEIGIAVLLRKCRLLSDILENENLKDWVLKELNGYEGWKDLPIYRVIPAGAKGLFLGSFQAQINDQPLASMVLKEEHRHFAERAFLREPANAYENLRDDAGAGYKIEWPANLVLMYQSKFFEGYALNRAWQDIPVHALRTIPETVKNRILEFALSVRKEFGNKITLKQKDVSNFIDSTVIKILTS